MKCTNCGADSSTPHECEYCGSPLSGPAPAPAPAPAAAPSPAPAPAPGAPAQPARSGSKLPLVLGIVAAVAFLIGVGGLLASRSTQALQAKVQATPVKTPAEAAQASGPVCVEGVVPQPASPLRLPERGTEVLYYEEKREERDTRSSSSSTRSTSSRSSSSRLSSSWRTVRSDTRWADALQVGELRVVPQGATARGATQLHQASTSAGVGKEARVTYVGIAAGTRLTLIGEVRDGTLQGGDPFLIAVAPSKQALVDDLSSSAGFLTVLGFGALLLALGAGVGAGLTALKG